MSQGEWGRILPLKTKREKSPGFLSQTEEGGSRDPPLSLAAPRVVRDAQRGAAVWCPWRDWMLSTEALRPGKVFLVQGGIATESYTASRNNRDLTSAVSTVHPVVWSECVIPLHSRHHISFLNSCKNLRANLISC